MAQLNDLLVMGQSTLLGPVNIQNVATIQTGLQSPIILADTVNTDTIYTDIIDTLNTDHKLTINGLLPSGSGQTRIGPGTGNVLDTGGFAAIDITPGLVKILNPNILQVTKINALTASNSTTYGAGTSGQVLKSNGSTVYWGSDNNTTYSVFTGASSSANGSSGLVPQPLIADRTKFLKGDGTWATVSTSDTKNTAGSNASDETLYLTGVKSGDFKDTYGVTYCHASVYMTAGALTAKSFNASSDKRLKENLISFIPQKSILDLPVYKYDFIDGVKNQIGCMAQDLQEICPEIVVEDENGYLSIQESKIVYLLIDEIKQLKNEIQQLKGRVNSNVDL